MTKELRRSSRQSSSKPAKKQPTYLVGHIVFAKCQIELPWAAKVVKIMENDAENCNAEPYFYKVKFYGHSSTAVLYSNHLAAFNIQTVKKYQEQLSSNNQEKKHAKDAKAILKSIELAQKDKNKNKVTSEELKPQINNEEAVPNETGQFSLEVNCSSKINLTCFSKSDFQLEPDGKYTFKLNDLESPNEVVQDKKILQKPKAIQVSMDIEAQEQGCPLEQSEFVKFEEGVTKRIKLAQFQQPTYLLLALSSLISKMIAQIEETKEKLSMKQRQIMHAILQCHKDWPRKVLLQIVNKMERFLKVFNQADSKSRNECYIEAVLIRSECKIWRYRAGQQE